MIIGTNRRLHESNSGELIEAHFKISGEAIEQKTSVKYLGVILDNQMKWKDHVYLISSKVSRATGILKYARTYTCTQTRTRHARIRAPNYATPCSVGLVPVATRCWDYPVFLIFTFILFLYTYLVK